MINELRNLLAREKARKKEIVDVLDKRIKNLEKAINNLESYNNKQEEVEVTLANFKIESVVEENEN